MVAIEAVVNSRHDDLKLLKMHTLDRKGVKRKLHRLFPKPIEVG